jgi:hypothetical protein
MRMIRREGLVGLFKHSRQLRDEGKAPFDVDDVCRWSYFFMDSDREKLIAVAEYLETQGYEFKYIFGDTPDDEPANEDDDDDTLWVRIDRVEKHTVKSLYALGKIFNLIAAQFDVIYDGMEVGAIDEP